jgi:hypothetical protein
MSTTQVQRRSVLKWIGIGAGTTVVAAGTTDDHVARIGLAPASPRPDPLADAIPRRHTNRGPYTAEPVDTAAFSAQRVEGADVRWVTERGARERLGALYVEATEAIVADTAQSEEAFSWFRNDRVDIDRYRDGLTLDGQGLDRLTLFAAKVLPEPGRSPRRPLEETTR